MIEIDKIAWICIKDKQLLVARSKGKDTFYLPGGKQEIEESDEAALFREIKEELSVDLIPTTIQYIKTFKAQAHEKPQGVIVKTACYTAEFKGTIEANAEIEEVSWFSYQDKAKCSLTGQIIMTWLKESGVIE